MGRSSEVSKPGDLPCPMSIIALRGAECWYYFEIFFQPMRSFLLTAVCVVVAMLCNQDLYAQNKVFERDPLFENLEQGDKGAILMVHFGTTHDDTRALTLDAINAAVKLQHPNLEVREAYTSRIIIKRLADHKGVIKLNPSQALNKLHEDGYTHVLIISTSLTNGVEMVSVRQEAEQVEGLFKRLRVATPLLYHESDYSEMLKVMTEGAQPDVATIWVGHGTYDVATAQYAMLDHMLQIGGYTNIMIGCVEGYPHFEQALQRLKASGLKKVLLRPLMIVAGEHAKEDIAGEWQELLTKEGYEVEATIQGLGELPQILKVINDKIDFYSNHRRVLIGEKKKVYEVTGEKLHADE
ncbi:hypothetical protein IX336_000888 [Porphyromonas levii]|nr:hypothetical protein [Porphyromonas levii]